MSGRRVLEKVLDERRRLRQEVLADLAQACGKMRAKLGKLAIILYGSYARGDFNVWSDVDILIISEAFEGIRFLDRYNLIGEWIKPGWEPKNYTPNEFRVMMTKPSWREALRDHVIICDELGINIPH